MVTCDRDSDERSLAIDPVAGHLQGSGRAGGGEGVERQCWETIERGYQQGGDSMDGRLLPSSLHDALNSCFADRAEHHSGWRGRISPVPADEEAR